MSRKTPTRGTYDHPEPYLVRYEDQGKRAHALTLYSEDVVNADPDLTYDFENFETLAAARRFAKSPKGKWGATIYQRVNVHEDTPSGWPEWYHTFDWDEEIIE